MINNRYCTEEEALQIIRQIIKGYKELILRKIVHRDLKPANILINKGVIKIADFGIARIVDRENERLLSTHVGTMSYMAPQVIQKVNYSRKCDIWSLGVILYELLFSRRPWYGRNE
jgi:calcium-dependent protein kinase